MTPGEAHLIARMQVALVDEGILHSITWTTAEAAAHQRTMDTQLIREAVVTAWPLLTDTERRILRRWRQ